ncbi:MAG: DUF4859 domain-containing protein [Mangrovibacterium sp.]
MKRNLIYLLISCFMTAFVACDDDILDATSKHEYSESENPYLRPDADAIISADFEFDAGHIEADTIFLDDYADKFSEKINMTVEQVISGLANGTVVFYSINSARGYWNRTEPTKDNTGWYYNSAGGVIANVDGYVATIDLDKTNKALIIDMADDVKAGTVLALNVGFAVNGPDYDDYVRFSFNVSVTDPSIIITNVTIPDGDYASAGIYFNQYAETIQICMGMNVKEFLDNLDYNGDTGEETDGNIHMYVINNETGEWDETSGYTAEKPGYWMNAEGAVCDYGVTGYSLYANTKNGDQVLLIGRAPELAAGTTFTISIGYKDTTNENNFFRLIITATLE